MAEETGTPVTDPVAEQEPAPQPAPQAPATGDEAALGEPGKRALDAMKAEKIAAVTAQKRLQKELDTLKAASMSDTDKAVAAAKAAGFTEASSAFGQRLARSDFVAAAARRNPAWDASAVLDDLNFARYVGDDGEPDAKAITAAVTRLVPEPPKGPPGFDGGARTPGAKPVNMSQLIRDAAAGRYQQQQ